MGVGRRVVVLGLLSASCSPGDEPDRARDYVVFYREGEVALDESARAVIGRAIEAGKREASFGLVVAGYAADPLAPEADQIRARIRQQLVADALLAGGIAKSRIKLEPRRALGGDPAIEGRRVEIRLAG